jgi:hypothetical protein
MKRGDFFLADTSCASNCLFGGKEEGLRMLLVAVVVVVLVVVVVVVVMVMVTVRMPRQASMPLQSLGSRSKPRLSVRLKAVDQRDHLLP